MDLNKLKSILKKIGFIMAGAVIGYVIYYYVFMEVVSYFIFSGDFVYKLVSILCLIGCIVGCMIILSLIIYREINKGLFIVIYITYFCMLFFILYGRPTLNMGFVINPLRGFKDLSDWEMQLQSIMNILAFIPSGYFFIKIEKKKRILLMIAIPTLIELIQALTYRGLFDTFDIIMYILGILIGCVIFKRFKIKIK